LAALLLLAGGAALAGCGGGSHTIAPTTATSPSRPVMLLATTTGEATGQTVDGIPCQTMEQLVYHIHAHLAVFVDGAPKAIPYGIGIAPPRQVVQTAEGLAVASGACFYWLHSHTADGIIHVESPVQRIFTLGEYFDIWRRPLSSHQVGPARGRVIAFVDGGRFTGNPRSITLTPHAVIQLDVGSPAPAPQPFSFPAGL
jgi:hypothetical protein